MIAKKPLVAKSRLQSKKTLRQSSRLTSLKKSPKKHSIGWYKREAQKYFNCMVKYRDSKLVNGAWIFECITCSRPTLFVDAEGRSYINAQAGHFQPTTKSRTRFNEMNVNGQCSYCNGPNLGEQVKYARALDMKYGDGTATSLELEAARGKQWITSELEKIINDCKEQLEYYKNLTII